MSKFVVSARKYRPTTFEDVIGQDHISRTLKNALLTDQLAHAFLFCGPRGVGKTTCARILAKVINCENPKEKVEPCNECSSCKSFNDNASFNIFELDAASNNSVEHIRTLIDQVRFQPQQGSYKVFIIDEVHMLSAQAFNAFLKTLEEPPSYAIFILATTEKHKIIPTILSRCQIFDFKRIQPIDVVKQLQHICDQEGKQAEPEALHQIALKADGAMRDALSIFDKISSSAEGDTITYKDVIVNLNLLDYDYFFRAVDAALRSDLSNMLMILDEVVKNGFDPEQFVIGLAEHMREVLVSKDPKTIGLMECSDSLKKRYYDQSQLITERFVLSSLNILNQCDINLSRANNKRLYTEVALSKVCYMNDITETNVFSAQSKVLEKKTQDISLISKTFPQPEPVDKVVIKNVSQNTSQNSLSKEKASNITLEKEVVASDRPTLKNTPSFKGIEEIKQKLREEEALKKEAMKSFSLQILQEIWNEHIEHSNSTSVKTALKNAILSVNSNIVEVKVPSSVGRDIITQEQTLIEKIRQQYGSDEVIMKIEIDKSLFPEIAETVNVKTYTQREIIEEMVANNREFVKFMDRLKLKPIDSSHY